MSLKIGPLKEAYTFGGHLSECFPHIFLEQVREQLPFFQFSSEEINMGLALKASMKSVGITSPNPAVGCVIKEGEKLLSVGHTETYGQRHAERVALEQLSAEQLNQSKKDLYVTLEPCAHQGQQPSCADMLSHFSWRNISIALEDVNPLVQGKGIQKILPQASALNVGVLNHECLAWHSPFFTFQKLKRPFFALKWAQDSHGSLAREDGTSKWITGPLARAYGHWLRAKYDAVVVGANTCLLDQPQLTAREVPDFVHHQPLRIIVDLRDRLSQVPPRQLNFLMEASAPWIVLQPKKKEFVTYSHVHFFETSSTSLKDIFLEPSFLKLCAQLRFGRPLQSFYIEGGAKLLKLFLNEGLVDLIHVMQSEKIELGTTSYQIPSSLWSSWRRLVEIRLGDDVLVEAIPNNSIFS